MKSKRISNVFAPCGIGEVVNPREVRYTVTCQEWFVQGVSASRTLPIICVHMWSVFAVSFHSANGSAGQISFETATRLLPVEEVHERAPHFMEHSARVARRLAEGPLDVFEDNVLVRVFVLDGLIVRRQLVLSRRRIIEVGIHLYLLQVAALIHSLDADDTAIAGADVHRADGAATSVGQADNPDGIPLFIGAKGVIGKGIG